MIRLDREAKRITWNGGDIVGMSRILGSEDAVKRWAPPVSSIIKLAAKKNMLMHKSARMELEAAVEWRKKCKELQALKDGVIDHPKAAMFWPHQRADLQYMEEMKLPAYLLAHEVGVGKTGDALGFAHMRGAERIAVVCRNAAKDQWRDEIIRWRTKKLPVRIVEGSTKEQVHTISSAKSGWVIGHHESMVHARDGWLDAPWDLIIVDEGHYFTNRKAQRTDTLLDMTGALRLVLTAHPFTNSISELFPILKFLYPDLYPSFWRWAHMHVDIDTNPFGGLDLRTPRRPNLLRWETLPFTLRRAKRDVWKDLPPVVRLKRVVQLTPRGYKEYARMKKQFFVRLAAYDGNTKVLAIPGMLARITRFRQYLIDPGILGASEPSPKYPEVLNLLNEIGKPTVIFTAYRTSAERLTAYLRKHKKRVDLLAGGQNKRVKPLKKKFLRGDLDALVIVMAVGGDSLNFGKYGYYIDLDLPLNPRGFEQTEGRVDRPEEGTGKMVATTGFRIVVKNSYEENQEERLMDKQGGFTSVYTVNTLKALFSDEEDNEED